MRILLLICLFYFNTSSVFSQCDSLESKTGLWSYYDADSILFKKIWYSNGNVDSVQYFDLRGAKINGIISFETLVLNRNVNEHLNVIKQKITQNFNWNNVIPQDGEGTVIISFTIEPTLIITNARVLTGIHYSLNKELIRCINTLDKSDVICCNDRENTVLVILPIKL